MPNRKQPEPNPAEILVERLVAAVDRLAAAVRTCTIYVYPANPAPQPEPEPPGTARQPGEPDPNYVSDDSGSGEEPR